MKGKYLWIKERSNPQLGTYYVLCGRITTREAQRMENSLYGTNYMMKFSTQEEYDAKIKELKEQGESVRL